MTSLSLSLSSILSLSLCLFSSVLIFFSLDTLIEQQTKNRNKSSNGDLSHIVEGIAIPSKIDTRTRRVGLGYSSLQELVFQVAEKTRKRSNSEFLQDDYLCVCGLPLGTSFSMFIFTD